MGKTKFERLEADDNSSAIFSISGKLGFHENMKVKRLTEECLKRGFERVIFDFSELSSLGGGVAKILRGFVKNLNETGGEVRFVVTNDVVIKFLHDDGTPLSIFETLEEALGSDSTVKKSPEEPEEVLFEDRKSVEEREIDEELEEQPSDKQGQPDDQEEQPADEELRKQAAANDSDVIIMSYDGDILPDYADAEGEEQPGIEPNAPQEEEAAAVDSCKEGGDETADTDNATPEIITEIFDKGSYTDPPEWIEKPTSPFNEQSMGIGQESIAETDINKQLKRRILELKTLFSISNDFNAIRDRRKLIDIFLLTSIAQGGVESALFLEKNGEFFEPVMGKGLEMDNLKGFRVPVTMGEGVLNDTRVMPLESSSVDGKLINTLKIEGIAYLCPFYQKDKITGLVFLGNRIAGRGMEREDFEFLRILISVAQSAYENALLFEKEHDRTLGIVKTLISLIEENTLLKGTSEFVSRYVGIVAKNMDYPDEHFNDLIYGTVLRDMGMIKVSDLIIRSPRELSREEWGIINKHPEDGAEMLRRMKFNDHVVRIVETHHERFNGEGYPLGLSGTEIPLGSRIISVVESYSAMIHERPNRPALSEREALDTLKENYGLRYDRNVVAHFSSIMEKELAKSVKVKPCVSLPGE